MEAVFSDKDIPGSSHKHGCGKPLSSLPVRCFLRSKIMRSFQFSPLSPHPLGLITTSFSLLRPLRKHRTLSKLNALAKNVAFLNSVTLGDRVGRIRWGRAAGTLSGCKGDLPRPVVTNRGPVQND